MAVLRSLVEIQACIKERVWKSLLFVFKKYYVHAQPQLQSCDDVPLGSQIAKFGMPFNVYHLVHAFSPDYGFL